MLLALVLALNFAVDAASIKSRSLKRQDLEYGDDQLASNGDGSDDPDKDADDDTDDNDDDHYASTSQEPPRYEVKAIKPASSKPATMLNKHDQENVRLELISNLRKQSHLKEHIRHLTNETASDEEIESSAKLVANETESVEMANMLSNMWKEMRMFDVPSYKEHVKKQLHDLKDEEDVLEAKLKGKSPSAKQTGTLAKGEKEKDTNANYDKDDGEDTLEKAPEDEKAVSTGNQGNASAVNFWRMSRASQLSVFLSSLVYLVAGVLAAVLFKQMYAKHFKLEDSLDGHPNNKNFSFPLFGCLGAGWKLCMLGFCCPCVAWANTVEQRLKVSFWKAFFAFLGLLLLHAYTMGISSIALTILGVYYRQKLRDSYYIDSLETGSKGTLSMDFLVWCFCQPCVIIQEAREATTVHEEDSNRDQPSGV